MIAVLGIRGDLSLGDGVRSLVGRVECARFLGGDGRGDQSLFVEDQMRSLF